MATGELPSHKGRYGWALIVRTADGPTRTYPNIQDDDEKIRRIHAELRHAIDEAVLRHGRGEDEVPEELRGMLHDESRS